MNCDNCSVGVLFVDKNRYLDLAGGDVLNIDICICEGFKHLGCNAGMSFHTCSYNRNLGDGVIGRYALEGENVTHRFNCFDCLFGLILGNGKGDVLGTVTADRLKNDVNIDLSLCKLVEYLEGNTGGVV